MNSQELFVMNSQELFERLHKEMMQTMEDENTSGELYNPAADTIERLEAENTDLREQLTRKSKKIERYQQWVNDLQSGMYVNCVYCGHRYGPADKVPTSMAEVLKQHVEQCPAHPMSQLKADLTRVTAERDAARLALDALRAQQEQPNEPLAVEELREMDGEPVWVEFVGRPDGSPIPPLWMIVDVGGKQFVTDVEYVDWGDEGWFAYRRKPEQED